MSLHYDAANEKEQALEIYQHVMSRRKAKTARDLDWSVLCFYPMVACRCL